MHCCLKITTAQTGQEGDKQWVLLYVTLLLHVLAVPRDAHDLFDYHPSQRLFRLKHGEAEELIVKHLQIFGSCNLGLKVGGSGCAKVCLAKGITKQHGEKKTTVIPVYELQCPACALAAFQFQHQPTRIRNFFIAAGLSERVGWWPSRNLPSPAASFMLQAI